MIQLKRGREKSLKRRHPWIFSGAVEKVSGKPQSGDTVELRSASGEVLARAAYSPQSQIRARVWGLSGAAGVGMRVTGVGLWGVTRAYPTRAHNATTRGGEAR